jgi:hypothetical protein
MNQFENVVEINEEEMVEYILEKMGISVDKAVIVDVLQWEFEFLKEKGVVESD